MSEPTRDGRSLLQLAISLRLAAQRLAKSANRMQEAAQHQRDQLDRLTLLRDRIVELLAVCRRIADKQRAGDKPHPAAPARPNAAVPPARLQSTRPRLPASAFVEFSNWQEFEKFRRMPPIAERELAECDIDRLIARLNGDAGDHNPLR
jgi:hypothetical protein